jgi:hypothetical protein
MSSTAKTCLAPALLVAALSACSGAQTEAALPPPPAATEPTCGADRLGGYVGSKATDDLVAKLRAWRGERPIRVLKPDSMATMDYRPDRLNIDVDAHGTIKGFRCA